jgi:hypothetical protein
MKVLVNRKNVTRFQVEQDAKKASIKVEKAELKNVCLVYTVNGIRSVVHVERGSLWVQETK